MKTFTIVPIIAICFYLAGCATGAKIENMTYHGSQKTYPAALEKNLEVMEVSGGKKTNPLWTSEISTDAFKEAIKSSLEKEGLLSANGQYQLEVTMLKVDKPIFGLDLEVTTYVQYKLTDSTTGQTVMDETIAAPHTATFGDSFAAVKRLRLANEGSGKKNIESFLSKLSELNISSKEISMSE